MSDISQSAGSLEIEIRVALGTRTDGWAWMALRAAQAGDAENARFYAAHQPGDSLRERAAAPLGWGSVEV